MTVRTTTMDFNTAIEQLKQNEGGFTVDSGGRTKFGISQRTYPELDIPALTWEDAKALYYKDYWVPAGCEELPEPLRFEVFDCAVNTSARGAPVTALRMLQQAANMAPAAQDGHFGPVTLAVVKALPPLYVLIRYMGLRLRYYTGRPDPLWTDYGEGWVNRVASNALRLELKTAEADPS